MSERFDVILDAAHRRCLIGTEPMIFHCHHYNVSLQQSLLDASFIELRPLLVGAAASVAHAQLTHVFRDRNVSDAAERAAIASELYRFCGFGLLSFDGVTERGGRIETASSHYALGWKSRFGTAKEPVCFFASGFIAGALGAIHGEPDGAYDVSHSECCAVAGETCVFDVKRGKASYEIYPSPGVGTLRAHEPLPVPNTPVDYDGILSAVSGMPLVGDADGNIPAFGVYLTRHYANYYNRVSFEYVRRLSDAYGDEGRAAATALLVEAGRVCAFNTFGGIMSSTEWDALIRPSLATDEDWVHGMVAVANALGWGRWQVTSVSADAAEFAIHDDYESVGYLAAYGTASHPVSFLAQGGVEGLMTLVYLARIQDRPTLDPAFYEKTFRASTRFEATPVSSRAMGDALTTFRVERKR